MKQLITIFFLLITIIINAQEFSPINNYSPELYGAENQNWDISQSSNKNIYIANNGGLLEFNGAVWKLHPSPNYTVLRSVKVIGERIYTGCYMEFGYWTKNNFGNLEYTSIIDKLEVPLLEEEQFWNIIEYNDWVLFQSLDRTYIYNSKDENFSIINSKTTRAEIFKVDNGIYFQKINEGIFKIEQGTTVLVSDNPIFQQNILVGFFSVDNQKLLLTEQGDFYFLDGIHEVRKWNISAEEKLQSVNVFSSLQLRNGNFLLGTISNGLYILDKKGEFVNKVNKRNGLINNTILSMFEDSDENLWLGLDNGISLVNLNSPFKVYNDFDGTLGVVYASTIFKEHLYLGTNQGVFYKKLNTSDDFKFLKNTKGQVWSLNVVQNTLFCGHNLGTYIIKNQVAEKIADFPGTWAVKSIENNENLLIQGNYSGLGILEKSGDSWKFRNKIEGFNTSSRFFEFISENQILVNHENKGIYTLTLDKEFKKVEKQVVLPPNGYGSSIIKFNEDILFSSNNGVQKYSIENQEFSIDSLITQKLFNVNDTIVGALIPDQKTNKLWGFSNKNIICLSQGKFNDEPQETKIPIPSSFRRNLGVIGFECLTNLKEQQFLIGGSNGYMILNLDRINDSKFNVSIDEIKNNTLDEKSSLVDLSQEITFENNANNLEFYYSVPNFNKFSETQYQYQLKGIYDKWSEWSSDSRVTFKNLPFGKYTFNVKARVGNTETTNIESFTFGIDKPWYLSNFMVFIYLLSIGLFSFFMHNAYKRYYTVQREKLLEKTQRELKMRRLENEQQLMSFKNEKLQHDIEGKNRELAISTMSLIKKNEFLNKIKGELMASEANSKVKPVINIIDKHINNSDDWKFFEEAFNNADKDFFKKMKKYHPDLTPNDLRLCAYLRLNLSSKEIAPLLNISAKSVDVKRYRLRKKMDLPHEASLTNYILEL
ncbi:triple tyrosine motif-containing protein [Urechidicola croceus]|uniref:triple tyrosine motif-containing protein n=1 Tax=Urechidicola croceus TaxID=1850246 RepID=UPI0009F639A8|nr:triple tyrosine motif-containing protein [Urechidicola croceus]